MRWCSGYGHRMQVRTRRLVSFVQRSVAAIRFEVEAVDRPLRIALQSSLVANQEERGETGDPRVARALGDVLEPRLAVGDDLRAVLAHTTRRTRLSVAAGMDHVMLDGAGEHRVTTDVEDDLGRVTVSVRLEPGKTLRVVKFLAYHWSSRQTVEWLRDQVDASLENALAEGWDGLAARSASSSTTGGRARTSSSTATPRSSRRCASRSSTSCRPARASRAGRSPPRA